MSNLYVFEFSYCDLVVAASVADAWNVLTEHNGDGFLPPDDDFEGDARWVQLPDDAERGFWSYPNGAVAEHEADGAEVVTRTCAEWAKLHGRGYMGSTEQ